MLQRELFKDLEEESIEDESLRSLVIADILVNRMDDYYERDDINATLIVKYKNHTIRVILDGGKRRKILGCSKQESQLAKIRKKRS